MNQPPFLVQIDQVGTSELRGSVRSHRVTVDRPQPKGGTDLGPLGGEYLLVALGGCFLSNLLAAARARGEELSKTRVVVRATTAESPPRFDSIELRVAVALEDRDLVRKLVVIAEHACLVTNTLKAAMPISIEVDGDR
jgi:putative redox protein